jgi:mannose/fructose/N-acetylgalactosamine-specific phosphotransferase system component IIC
MVGWMALFGAVVYLDTTAAFQFMLCQPIMACPLYGLIVGRPEVGIFFGISFQLLWLRALPVGAARFPEGNLGALIATVLACAIPPTTDGQTSMLILACATLAGLLAASLGRHLTPTVRQVMRRIADSYQSAVLETKNHLARALFVLALGINAAAGAAYVLVLYVVSLFAMQALLGVSTQTPLSMQSAELTDDLWGGLNPALLGAGVGIAAQRFVRNHTLRWTIGGFAMGLIILLCL